MSTNQRYDPVLVAGKGFKVTWWRMPGGYHVIRHIEDPSLLREGEDPVKHVVLDSEQEARVAAFMLAADITCRRFGIEP